MEENSVIANFGPVTTHIEYPLTIPNDMFQF